jgi:hypothetical protein
MIRRRSGRLLTGAALISTALGVIMLCARQLKSATAFSGQYGAVLQWLRVTLYPCVAPLSLTLAVGGLISAGRDLGRGNRSK